MPNVGPEKGKTKGEWRCQQCKQWFLVGMDPSKWPDKCPVCNYQLTNPRK